MYRSSRPTSLLVALLFAVAFGWPSAALAQRGQGHGGGHAAPAGGGRSAPAGGGTRTAVPRGSAGPSHGGHPGGGPVYGHGSYGHGYYGHGYYGHAYYGPYWGGFYYPPFVSFYGWYPYSWGWSAGWGWGYPYPYGPYGYGPYGYWPYDTTASVRLQVTPREAEVYVDGYYAGLVDDFDGTFQRLRILPGPHELTIYMPGYRSATERMYFRPTGSYKVAHALERLAAGQPDEPKPKPSPRAVAAQGRDRDRVEPYPGEPEPQAPEPRWPEPAGAGSRPAPGDPRDPMEPRDRQASSFGSLVVRVQPDGASVVVDGERWQGPALQDRLVLQLSGGRHHVEITREGYLPYAGDVDVRAGESTVLNVSLPPADRR